MGDIDVQPVSMRTVSRDGSVRTEGRIARRPVTRPLAGNEGIPRMSALFDEQDVTTTWYVPGHTIETFRDNVEAIAEAGHEIGIHGYTHENPTSLTREQEDAIMQASMELVEEVTGDRPVGHRASWREFSENTPELLEEHDFLYDSSLMDGVRTRLRAKGRFVDENRVRERRRIVDGAVQVRRGNRVVEIPISWFRDHIPPMQYQTAELQHGRCQPADDSPGNLQSANRFPLQPPWCGGVHPTPFYRTSTAVRT